MRYFGIPTCPYCKKRVNIVRTWSLKKQGEYRCPRCSGISNIYLSPLVYVLGLFALFAGGSIYFFHKFVLDDIELKTALHVFVPFAVFFLFSLFMVYLEKPVIKKVSKEEYQKKRRIRAAVENSQSVHGATEYFDDDDYTPRNSHRPGPSPQAGSQEESLQGRQDTGVVNQQAFSRAKQRAAAENGQISGQISQRPHGPKQNAPGAQNRLGSTQAQARPVRPVTQPISQPVSRPVSPQASQSVSQPGSRQAAQRLEPVPRPAGYNAAPKRASRVVSGVETPINDRNLLEKYDDTAYIQRRLKNMDSGRNTMQNTSRNPGGRS